MSALRCVLTCLTVSEQVYRHACVCKFSRVRFIALGGCHWSDLRLRWDKVLVGDEAGREREKRGGVNPGSRDNPQSYYQQGRVIDCVCSCLRHLELEL